MLTTGIADGTKKLADRRRPAFHYGVEAETEAGSVPEEEYLSFFSGDTAWAFNFAAAGTTLAYLRDYPTAPYVAVGSGTFARAAGLLRVSADMHWTSDMLAGALVGSAIGFSVPFFLHQRDRRAPPLAIAPSITKDHAMLLAAGEL